MSLNKYYQFEVIRMKDTLSPSILEDFRRFHAYGWLPGLITHVLNRRHGLHLTAAAAKQLCREIDRAEEHRQSEGSKIHVS